MVGVYHITISHNKVYKYLKRDNEVGDKLYNRLKKSKHVSSFKYLIEKLYLNVIIGKHIVSGICLGVRGDYVSPLIHGITLAENGKIDILDSTHLVELIISIGLLTKSLTQYYKIKGYIIGDWTLHNIIFSIKTGTLINIDLEGFYTYSPYGLELSWNSGENNYSVIKQRLGSLQKRLIKKIYVRYTSLSQPPTPSRPRPISITPSPSLSNPIIITVINIPDGYQISVPFRIETKYTNISIYLQYIKPTILCNISNRSDTPNIKTYKVFIKVNSLIPHQLIVMNTSPIKIPPQYRYLYTFYLDSDGHFSPVIIHHMSNPLRSKLVFKK